MASQKAGQVRKQLPVVVSECLSRKVSDYHSKQVLVASITLWLQQVRRGAPSMCKTRENSNFLKNGKTVILVENPEIF